MAKDDINAEIRPVASAAELHDVQRFKYDVYVAEMGRYGAIADHANRLLIEADDPASHIFQARVDDRLVQITWQENVAKVYDLDSFDLLDFATQHQSHAFGDQLMLDQCGCI